MADRLFLRLADDPLYAPETTVPAGTMQAFSVPRLLAPYVANAMAYEERLPPGAQVTERVLPDGALRLIVDTGGQVPCVRVAGPGTQAVVLTHRGHLQGLSFTLRPGASHALLGVPAHELAGRSAAWEDVAAAPARPLAQRLLEEAATAPGRVATVWRTLAAGLRTVDAAERQRTQAALQWLAGHPARRPVRDVAALLGVSERRVEQLFRDHVGLTPKTWHRLARFHACVRLLRQPRPPGWAEVAAEAGFHDQAHLVNEFRALCGLTPGQYAAERGVSGFSKTHA